MFTEYFSKLDNSYKEVKNLLKSQKIEEAKQILGKRESSESKFLLALLEMILKNSKRTISILEEISNDIPVIVKKDIYYEILATAYFNLGDAENSQNNYEKSISLNEKNLYSRINLANIYINKKMYEEAFEIYSELIKELSEDKNVMRNYSYLLKKVKIDSM